MEEKKGLWQQVKNEYNVVEWNPSKFNLKELDETIKTIQKHEITRRERLDKEYTDIGKITIAELDEVMAKYNGNVPNGLMVKVKIAGQYSDMPIKVVQQLLTAIQEQGKRLYEEGKSQTRNQSAEERNK